MFSSWIQDLIPLHFRLPCRLRTFQFTERESNLEGVSSPSQPAQAHETREPGPRLPDMTEKYRESFVDLPVGRIGMAFDGDFLSKS